MRLRQIPFVLSKQGYTQDFWKGISTKIYREVQDQRPLINVQSTLWSICYLGGLGIQEIF